MNTASQCARAERFESMLCRWLETLLGATFMLIFALVVLLVVLRYVFNTTIVGGNEIAVQLFIYTTALGAAVEIARGKHIIVDFFINYLPVGVRHWLDIFNLFLVGTLHAFLLKYSIDWVSAVGGNEHPVTHLAEGIVQVAIPVGCTLSVIFCITRILNTLAAKPAAVQ